MNANVKIVLGLGVLLLAVSGITVISNYTARDESTDGKTVDVQPGTDFTEAVQYDVIQIYYNPASPHPALREFPGFFEVNDQEHSVTYWLQNINPVPVSVSAVSRSCSACTNVRLAVFPTVPRDTARDEVERAALGVAGSQVLPFAELDHRLRTYPAGDWKLLDFDHPEILQTIPAGGGEERPMWIALKLNFKVRELGQKILDATLGFKTPDQTTTMTSKFGVGFVGVPRFEVVPATLDFKEIGESTPSKTEEILYLSATVPQDRLAPPRCTEPASEPFLKFTKPVALTPQELDALVAKRTRGDSHARITGGYRVLVTLHRKNPDPKPGIAPELDIGPLAKSFTVFGDTEIDNQAVQLKAVVTGLVTLERDSALDLGPFPAREGTVKPFSLRSDRLDLELEVATELAEPKVLQITLEPPRNEEGRRYWALKVKIPANVTTGELASDSVVVLRVKGTGQLIRLPIKGRAFLRSN